MRWRSFVAMGDSFTEGLDDPDPHRPGRFRGWADLVAAALATHHDSFGYANLAIRGRLFGQVVAEQVPAALAMAPDLISFAAGVNDALRRHFDPAPLVAGLDTTIGQLRATGADVLLFRTAAVAFRLPRWQLVGTRLAVLNQAVGDAVDRHGAILVDLAVDGEFTNPALWSHDRLHLGAAGHHRVAAHVLTALRVDPEPSWWDVPPRPLPRRWPAARTSDLAWAGRHLVPWVRRRLTGRSSGDGITPKRPTLTPVERGDGGGSSRVAYEP